MMNLNLSMAMVITVMEDMKAAKKGIVRVSLDRATRVVICYYSQFSNMKNFRGKVSLEPFIHFQ